MKRIASTLSYLLGLIILVAACGPESTKPEAHIIGELTSRRSEQLKSKIRTTSYSSGTHHLIVQGSKLGSLTESEEQAILSSYLENYRIVILEVSEAHLKTFRNIIQDDVGVSHKSPQVIDVVVARRDPESGLPITTFYIDATTKAPIQPDDAKSSYDPDAVEDELLANGIVKELLEPRVMMSLLGSPERLMAAQSASPSIPWPANKSQPISVVAGGGVFNTSFDFWGVRQCSTGNASYVGIATNNWSPGTVYEYAVVADNDKQGQIVGYTNSEGFEYRKVGVWHTASSAEIAKDGGAPNSCGTDAGGSYQNTACQIVNYPAFYTVTMNPTGSALTNVIQSDTGPSISGGPTTTETSGFSFSLGGNIGGSTAGPTAGVSAGATWSSSTSVTVPSTQMYKVNLSDYTPQSGSPTSFATPPANNTGVGAGWTIQYCTQPTSDGNCGLPYVGVKSHLSCDEKLGLPLPGQLSNDSVSEIEEAVYWTDSSPVSSTPSTFPVTVSFESNLQTTTLLVWNRIGNNNPPPFGGTCDEGAVGAHCSCVPITTDAAPVVVSMVLDVPVPPPCPPPLLTLNKVVVNQSGADLSQWTLAAENSATGVNAFSGTSGITATITAGTYKLTESGPSGYSLNEILCSDKTRGPVAAEPDGYSFNFLNGDVLTCTFYNQPN